MISIFSGILSIGFENGKSVVKLNGLVGWLLTTIFTTALWVSPLTISIAENSGPNSFSKNSASGAPTLKINRLPTLPKIVLERSSAPPNHSCLSWSMY